jgi:uncharacterized membrane protein YfcA
VGGGGIFVPVLSFLGGFSLKDAIPLSNVFILGGSVASLWVNAPLRHPVADRPLIDYVVSMVIGPMLLGGTMVGVLLNTVSPDFMVTGLLAVVLTFATYRIWKKAVLLHRREKSRVVAMTQRIGGLQGDSGTDYVAITTPSKRGVAPRRGGSVLSLFHSETAASPPPPPPHGGGRPQSQAVRVPGAAAGASHFSESHGLADSGLDFIEMEETPRSSLPAFARVAPQSFMSAGRSLLKEFGVSRRPTKDGSYSKLDLEQGREGLIAKDAEEGEGGVEEGEEEEEEAGGGGLEDRERELDPEAAQKAPGHPAQSDDPGLLLSSAVSSPIGRGEIGGVDAVPFSVELRRLVDSERRTPVGVVVAMIAIVAVLALFSIARGKLSGTSLFGVKSCGTLYWVLFAAIFPFLAVAGVLVFRWVRRKEERKVALGYDFKPGDVRFSKRMALLIPAASLVGGVLSSFLGIGGGMVLGPLLLELNVNASVGAATSAFLILLSSSMACLQFALIGRVLLDYALVLFVVGVVSGYIGLVLLHSVVRRTGKESVTVFVIVAVVAVSNVLLIVTGLMKFVSDVENKNKAALAFMPPCI